MNTGQKRVYESDEDASSYPTGSIPSKRPKIDPVPLPNLRYRSNYPKRPLWYRPTPSDYYPHIPLDSNMRWKKTSGDMYIYDKEKRVLVLNSGEDDETSDESSHDSENTDSDSGADTDSGSDSSDSDSNPGLEEDKDDKDKEEEEEEEEKMVEFRWSGGAILYEPCKECLSRKTWCIVPPKSHNGTCVICASLGFLCKRDNWANFQIKIIPDPDTGRAQKTMSAKWVCEAQDRALQARQTEARIRQERAEAVLQEKERRAERARLEEEKRRAEKARLEKERRAEEARLEEERRAEEARLAQERSAEEARLEEERHAEAARLQEERLEEEGRPEEDQSTRDLARSREPSNEAEPLASDEESRKDAFYEGTQDGDGADDENRFLDDAFNQGPDSGGEEGSRDGEHSDQENILEDLPAADLESIGDEIPMQEPGRHGGSNEKNQMEEAIYPGTAAVESAYDAQNVSRPILDMADNHKEQSVDRNSIESRDAGSTERRGTEETQIALTTVQQEAPQEPEREVSRRAVSSDPETQAPPVPLQVAAPMIHGCQDEAIGLVSMARQKQAFWEKFEKDIIHNYGLTEEQVLSRLPSASTRGRRG